MGRKKGFFKLKGMYKFPGNIFSKSWSYTCIKMNMFGPQVSMDPSKVKVYTVPSGCVSIKVSKWWWHYKLPLVTFFLTDTCKVSSDTSPLFPPGPLVLLETLLTCLKPWLYRNLMNVWLADWHLLLHSV